MPQFPPRRHITIAVVAVALGVAAALVAKSVIRPSKPSAAERPATTLRPIPTGATTPAGQPIARLSPTVRATFPHDRGSYTQGLVIDDRGRLFESAGQYGQSDIREVDRGTGKAARQTDLDGHYFAEGLAVVDDTLIQLTWKEKTAFTWNRDTFSPGPRFAYEGEGWGLCYDGTRLVMSNGSPTLTFRDPRTFATIGTVNVTRAGSPITQLNELECVDGKVYANVYQTNTIVVIEPTTGAVTADIDATGLLPEPDRPGADVLNGIAYQPDSRTFLITGKLWPTLFEVTFDPVA